MFYFDADFLLLLAKILAGYAAYVVVLAVVAARITVRLKSRKTIVALWFAVCLAVCLPVVLVAWPFVSRSMEERRQWREADQARFDSECAKQAEVEVQVLNKVRIDESRILFVDNRADYSPGYESWDGFEDLENWGAAALFTGSPFQIVAADVCENSRCNERGDFALSKTSEGLYMRKISYAEMPKKYVLRASSPTFDVFGMRNDLGTNLTLEMNGKLLARTVVYAYKDDSQGRYSCPDHRRAIQRMIGEVSGP